MNINFAVKKQSLWRTDSKPIAEKSLLYLKAVFALDEEWSDTDVTKTAVFAISNGTAYHVLLGSDGCATNEAYVAQEVLREGFFAVGLIGEKLNDDETVTRITTNVITVKVDRSAALSGDNTDMTPSMYDQIMALLAGGAAPGKSAYEIAVENGFVGTEEEWLDSLVGAPGAPGVKGDKGDTGDTGAQGPKGDPGVPGTNGSDGQDGVDGYSPTATVTKSGSTATITITDKNGTTTATVSDGGDATSPYVIYYDNANGEFISDHAYLTEALIDNSAEEQPRPVLLQTTGDIWLFLYTSGTNPWVFSRVTSTAASFTSLSIAYAAIYYDAEQEEFIYEDFAATIELNRNKVTSLSAQSTDTQYPSAKAVYEAVSSKYTKPATGIPKTDLTEDVKTSLGKADTAVQPAGLSSVATSGSYDDLTNKPTIPTVPTQLSDFTDDLGNSPTHTHSQYLTAHQDISGKENTSNKVTAWQYTPDDTHYPSEKLVKDSLDTKGTYSKPSGGIPKSDLADAVKTSLEKADSALQSHQDISGKENSSNKVTSLSSSSTDTEYPSAKCVYDLVGNIETILATLTTGGGVS